ncbi:hypothetical protein GGX14DRAFT_402791 [Mycena pura]|uniref:Uncharacterized protein n=1 Tax=Mycena pura TaxID=153505 RepID=A0AAD6UXG1_9AGAR|nr:hypothetical protein GGX14DRAFT_402791 [Mycena pura]
MFRIKNVMIDVSKSSLSPLGDNGHDDEVIVEALEAYAQMFEYYETLCAGSYGPVVPSASSSTVSTSLAPAKENDLTLQWAHVFESVLNTLSSNNTVHPVIPLVASEPSEPRLAVVCWYFVLVKMDKNCPKGACPFCLVDPELPTTQATKDHSNHFIDYRSKSWDGESGIPVVHNMLEDDNMEDEVRQTVTRVGFVRQMGVQPIRGSRMFTRTSIQHVRTILMCDGYGFFWASVDGTLQSGVEDKRRRHSLVGKGRKEVLSGCNPEPRIGGK